MTCDVCKQTHEIKNKFMHLPDTDGIISVTLLTDEVIGHHQFVGAIGQLYRELVAAYTEKAND